MTTQKHEFCGFFDVPGRENIIYLVPISVLEYDFQNNSYRWSKPVQLQLVSFSRLYHDRKDRDLLLILSCLLPQGQLI